MAFLSVKRIIVHLLTMSLMECRFQVSCTNCNNLQKTYLTFYSKLLSKDDRSAGLVSKTRGKNVLGELYSEKENKLKPVKKTNSKTTKTATARGKKIGDKCNKIQGQDLIKVKNKQTKRRMENSGISIDDVQKFDRLYSNGSVSFGNRKRLHKLSNL